MTEDKTPLVRRFYEEVINKGSSAAMDELVATDFLDHGALPGLSPGREGLRQFLAMLGSAFPDIRVSVEDIVSETDKVVARIVVRGTHQGELMGTAPTSKQVSWSGIDIIRIAEGRLVERWSERDLLGLMQQLRVVPAPGQS